MMSEGRWTANENTVYSGKRSIVIKLSVRDWGAGVRTDVHWIIAVP